VFKPAIFCVCSDQWLKKRTFIDFVAYLAVKVFQIPIKLGYRH